MVRADAQRNIDALLTAAMTVFTTSGVDAPAKQIADLAGVGVGTVCRHFPQRSDLVVAVLRHEGDEQAALVARWLDAQPSAFRVFRTATSGEPDVDACPHGSFGPASSPGRDRRRGRLDRTPGEPARRHPPLDRPLARARPHGPTGFKLDDLSEWPRIPLTKETGSKHERLC